MKNYMKEVAEMLGVEFGEEFEVKYEGPTAYRIIAKFSDNGITLVSGTCEWGNLINTGRNRSAILYDLLNGAATIVRKPWKPKDGECYYYVNTQAGVFGAHWNNCTCDIYNYKLGNCYRTPEEANAESKKWIEFYSSEERIKI